MGLLNLDPKFYFNNSLGRGEFHLLSQNNIYQVNLCSGNMQIGLGQGKIDQAINMKIKASKLKEFIEKVEKY